MKKIAAIIVSIILSGFLVYAASIKKGKVPAEKSGKVSATGDYERYFGPAPSVDKGAAYAFVIYFPSSKEPGKVVPFPFFTFDEGSIKKVAIERLLGGMDTGGYQGEHRLFPAGTRLVAISEHQGIARLVFSKELLTDKDLGILRSISLTMKQFSGIKDVRVHVEGRTKSFDVNGADNGSVASLSPPRLLSVIAMKDKGASEVEEVDVFFDRPVDVKELRLSSEDGVVFEGDIFHSVFDMAAVLKPQKPAQFKDKLPIKVRWKVTDKLGRFAEGENIWLLEIRQHER